MPQPYLPTFKHKRYQIGFESLNERPQFAELIGRCIALWSYVDNELGGLFGILLRTNSDAAQRVFLVLRRWFNQRQALDAAAEGVLVGDERLLFRALMVEYGSLESQRNDLCHGCFGICPDDETLLFMIKIEHHVVWQADILPKHLRGDIPPELSPRTKRAPIRLSARRTAQSTRFHASPVVGYVLFQRLPSEAERQRTS